MEIHGFGRKTFQIETDAARKTVVHHVKGKFNGTYYRKTYGDVSEEAPKEIYEQFDISNHIYLLVVDIDVNAYGFSRGGVPPAKSSYLPSEHSLILLLLHMNLDTPLD